MLFGSMRVRAFVVLAAVVLLGVAPGIAAAESDSPPRQTEKALGLLLDENGESAELVETRVDGSYESLDSAAATPGDSISVGPPTFTGLYKTIVSGPHVTKVKVYRRSMRACHGEELGAVVQCLSGSIVYAAGFAACFQSCTVAGLRGSLVCATAGSGNFPGWSVSLAGCYSQLYGTGPSAGSASKAVEIDKVCNQGPIQACVTKAWHLNAYPTGNVTGPYGGEGNA